MSIGPKGEKRPDHEVSNEVDRHRVAVGGDEDDCSHGATLSVSLRGHWFDTSTADFDEAVRQFAAHQGSEGGWRTSRLPPSPGLTHAVAFRQCRSVATGGSDSAHAAAAATPLGYVIPPKRA